ncbi:MAG TPA: hypothetical protein V6D17_16645 [Candidatus Obscuribacterales bacterium]
MKYGKKVSRVALALSTFVLMSPPALCQGDQQQTATPSQENASPAASQTGVLPGPLQTERQQIVTYIDAARKRGVGVASYESLFKSIEAKVSAGASEQEISPLVTRLKNALVEQNQRSYAIKYQAWSNAVKKEQAKARSAAQEEYWAPGTPEWLKANLRAKKAAITQYAQSLGAQAQRSGAERAQKNAAQMNAARQAAEQGRQDALRRF